MKLKLSTIALLLLLVVCLSVGCATDSVKPTDSNPYDSESDLDETATDTTADTEAETETGTETPPETDDVVLRIGVMSDTHIGENAVTGNMSKALEALKTVSGDRLDVMLFAGDLTNTTGSTPDDDAQIRQFRGTYIRQLEGTPFVYCLGSTHDVPVSSASDLLTIRQLYKDTLGNFDRDINESAYVDSGIRHVEMNGYHVFAVDYSSSEAGLENMVDEMRALTEADADRPIFVIMHNPVEVRVPELLSEFPQVICFSGHFHNSAAREDSIKQDNGYTQVHIGGTAYYRVDGYNRFNTDDPFLNLGNIYQFAQSLYVEVHADNTVTIDRVDGYAESTYGEQWVVSPDRRDVYTDARKTDAVPCTFPEGATVTVTEDGTAVKVAFGAAISGDAGPAMYYRVSLMEKVGSTYLATQVADLSSQQVFYPDDVGIPENHYQYTFNNVNVEDYGIVVQVIDCWQTSESVLTYSSGNFVYGAPSVPDDGGNVALGKTVTVTEGVSLEGHPEYDPSMLTDGLFGYYSNHPDRLRGWNKAVGFVPSEENPIDIVIDLGETYDISEIVIHPIVSYNSCFPTYFEYQVSTSESGDDWVTVKANTDVVCNGRLSGSASLEDYDPDNHYDVTFEEPVTARRVRIHITTPSALYDNGENYMGFGEVEIYGEAA